MSLPLALWPVAIGATVAGYALLFAGDADVPAAALITRSVGPSFIACGLIAWQRRPANRTGRLMALTGFLFLGGQLLGEADDGVLHRSASSSPTPGPSRSPRSCSASRRAR